MSGVDIVVILMHLTAQVTFTVYVKVKACTTPMGKVTDNTSPSSLPHSQLIREGGLSVSLPYL